MNTAGFSDVLVILPLIIMFLTSLVPISIKIINHNKEGSYLSTVLYASIGLILSIGTLFYGGFGVSGFSDTIVVDGLVYISSILVIIITIFTLLLSYQSLDVKADKFSEHVFLIINAAIGIIVVFMSNNLLVAFIGIELMSLAFYVLTGLSLEEKLSKEASLKYFIIGSVASAILLYGISLIYGSVGSLSITELRQNVSLINEDPLFLTGFILLTVGFLFKASVFPFHAWVPDVYQGAPTPSTVYMSTAGKVVGFVFLIKLFLLGFLNKSILLIDTLQWLSVLTMLVGGLCALRQESLKRLLAYSSIAHSGYVLIGIVCLGFEGSNDGAIVMFYLLSYVAMNFGAFAIVSLLETKTSEVVLISDLKKLRSKPLYAALFSICLLSLAGLPPTMGFFGKFYLFSAAINKGLFWLVLWAVISTIVSIYYYIRPILIMYSSKEEKTLSIKPNFSLFVLIVSSVIILLGGVFSENLLSIFLNYMEQM